MFKNNEESGSYDEYDNDEYFDLSMDSETIETEIKSKLAVAKEKEDQAQRVAEFMNYQMMHVMEEYDPELDQMLFHLPLAGSAFKKVYLDNNLGRPVSKFVPADDLVVPYTATDLQSSERVTYWKTMLENLLTLLKKWRQAFSLEEWSLLQFGLTLTMITAQI